MTTSPLRATIGAVHTRDKPNRLISVTDPDLGDVRVWWSLDRPAMWRCTRHGRMSTPACPHTLAAAVTLSAHLFGIEAAITIGLERPEDHQ